MWEHYPIDYREHEVATLMHWIAAGQSGSVIGLPGCGRSNLLDFICYRPEVVERYLPALVGRTVLLSVNLYDLPTSDVATFHRVLLRAFHLASSQFSPELEREVVRFHQAALVEHDPFLSQSAMHDLMLVFQEAQIRVVLVLNYLHHFLNTAPPETVKTLRGLRDRFKGSLCFISGLNKDFAALPHNEGAGGIYELLDRNTCWVGAMEEQDALNLIDRATIGASTAPDAAEVEAMLRLSGSFPAVLKLIATWWLSTDPMPTPDAWLPVLARAGNIKLRLDKMWDGLAHEEQMLLQDLLNRAKGASGDLQTEQGPTLTRLAQKGVCWQTEAGWEIRGTLLALYIAKMESETRTDIWIHDRTGEIYQGASPVADLAPLEEELLRYFIEHPYTPHDKEALITHLWPGKRHEMSHNDLQQLVYRLRKKVDTQLPQRIVTWRGRPGGYRFYPEGYTD